MSHCENGTKRPTPKTIILLDFGVLLMLYLCSMCFGFCLVKTKNMLVLLDLWSLITQTKIASFRFALFGLRKELKTTNVQDVTVVLVFWAFVTLKQTAKPEQHNSTTTMYLGKTIKSRFLVCRSCGKCDSTWISLCYPNWFMTYMYLSIHANTDVWPNLRIIQIYRWTSLVAVKLVFQYVVYQYSSYQCSYT